jgi:peroxiredoxin
MALTPSNPVALGTDAIDFQLPDATGKVFTLAEVAGRQGLLVAFICNHCPFVKIMKAELAQLGRDLAALHIGMVAINANDSVTYPEDSPANMIKDVEIFGYAFPYLVDETQQVARAYQAACTPDFFLYDAALQLVYHGQLDDARPGNGIAVTGKDLRDAVQKLRLGQPCTDMKPSMGCNIKWKSDR